MGKELQHGAPQGSTLVEKGWLCQLSPHRGALGAMVCDAECYAGVSRQTSFPGAPKPARLDGALSPVSVQGMVC